MARLSTYEESKQYETSGNFDIFNLPDDGSSDMVQFLSTNLDEILTYTIHEIDSSSRNNRAFKRKVGCLKHSSQDPAGVCPLCDAGYKIKLARFIPLYSHKEKKVLLWERGNRFVESQWGGLVQRLNAQGKNVRNTVIEIVRNGRKGDQQTTYAFYPSESTQPVDISNLEIPDADGILIASWSPQDMQQYVATGKEPVTNTDDSQVQRRSDAAPAPQYQAAPYGQQPMQAPAPQYQAPPVQAGGFTGMPVANPEDAF